MKFRMTTATEDNDCLISIAGSLDSGTCAAAEQRIDDAIASAGSQLENIILDFKNLLYISSLGLRILFRLAKLYPAKVKIINVPGDIMDVFKMTGIDKTMTVA
ncbi:MAG: STAS domain-containing protein [Synergistaceae bacterium]|nr:STAS domain-containing protein [Synergistaceae bacterium]